MIVALIPARGGSERIPGKNLKKLDGIPLVAWTVVTALACQSIDMVLVSSDSVAIRETAEKFGAQPLERPISLAGAKVQDLPVINHLLQVVPGVDLVVYLRPTTPLRATHTVEAAIQAMLEAGPKPTGLRSVHKMGESAFKCFTARNGLLQPILWYEPLTDSLTVSQGRDVTDLPEQEVEATYKPNGYVDIILPATVAAGSCFGDTKIQYVTPRIHEVDEPEDWEYLEYLVTCRGVRETHEFYCRPGSRSQPWGN